MFLCSHHMFSVTELEITPDDHHQRLQWNFNDQLLDCCHCLGHLKHSGPKYICPPALNAEQQRSCVWWSPKVCVLMVSSWLRSFSSWRCSKVLRSSSLSLNWIHFSMMLSLSGQNDSLWLCNPIFYSCIILKHLLPLRIPPRFCQPCEVRSCFLSLKPYDSKVLPTFLCYLQGNCASHLFTWYLARKHWIVLIFFTKVSPLNLWMYEQWILCRTCGPSACRQVDTVPYRSQAQV